VPINLLGGLLCLAVAPALGSQPAPLNWREGLLILGLGIIPTVLGHGGLNLALKHLRGQVVALGNLGQFISASILAFFILITFHPLAVALGVGSLALVAIYPFAKRFTWWPQIFLGLAFNWGALLAWAAALGSLSWAPVLLYLGGIAWTLFYDTIYAHQDAEDDALLGVKSTARLFGERSPLWLRGFLAACVTLMTVGLILALAPGGNPLALVVALAGAWGMGWHMAWQLARLDIADGPTCLRLFRSNRDAGLIPVAALALALLV
jgi:4-hydroxybenzoate polyprenyltransferase